MARNKISKMSKEYKYNFFLRLAIEVYLECCVLWLLNLRYAKFESNVQIISVTVSAVLIILCILLVA